MDFVSFQACVTSEIIIYVLWSLNILLVAYVVYSSFSVILARFENFFEQRKTKKDYTLWHNKGLIGVIAYFCFSLPFQVAMAILHLVIPTTRIGFDPLPTALFFFAKTGFYVTVIFTTGPMLAVTLKGDPRRKYLVKFGYMMNIFSSSLAIAIGALPIVTLIKFQGNLDEQVLIFRAYLFSQTIAMFITAALSLLVLKKVNRALDSAQGIVVSQEMQKRTQSIKKKIYDLQFNGFKQGIVQGVIYLILGLVPELWMFHMYFLPISWFAFPLLGKKLAHQINLDKRGARTIMQRLGIKKTSTVEGGQELSSAMIPTPGGLATTTLYTPSSVSNFNIRKEPVSSSAQSETAQMEDLLNPQSKNHKVFMEYVKKRYALNEVNLVEECIRYKRAKNSQERTRIGKQIINKFILDGASQQVDVPHTVKKNLETCLAKNIFHENTFDQVRAPLIFDLKGNFNSALEKKFSGMAQIGGGHISSVIDLDV